MGVKEEIGELGEEEGVSRWERKDDPISQFPIFGASSFPRVKDHLRAV